MENAIYSGCSTRQPGLISLLRRLQECDEPLGAKELGWLLESITVSADEVMPWIRFEDGCYTRTPLLELDHVEVLLLCWQSGQLSPIHDHSGSACAVKVVSGVATEISYSQAPNGLLFPNKGTQFPTGSVTFSSDADTHQLGNLESSEDLVTLHCYSPPLKEMHIFGREASVFSNYDIVFDTAAKRQAEKGKAK